MAGETYRYNVVIGVSVNTAGARSGSRDLDAQLTSFERRAVQASDRIQKNFDRITQSIERLEKVLGKLDNAGLGKGIQKSTDETIKGLSKVQQIEKQTAREAVTQQNIRFRSAQKISNSIVTVERNAQNEIIRYLQKTTQAEIDQLRARQRAREQSARALRTGGQGLQQAGFAATATVTAPLVELARQAAESAVALDSNRKLLSALEGGTDKAEKKMSELFQLARESTGVFTDTVTEAYAQFRVIDGISEKSINNMIKALGRLNAAFTIPDQIKFRQNIVQLFTQNFNVRDIREATRAVPIFPELLRQAFGTDDPKALRELKKSGKITIDKFIGELANAVENNPKLANLSQSLGVQFQKELGFFKIAIAPLGDEIYKILIPAFQSINNVVTVLSDKFRTLPEAGKQAIVILGALAASIGPLLTLLGTITIALGGLAFSISALGGMAVVGPILADIGVILAGLIASLVATAAAAAALWKAWDTNWGPIASVAVIAIGAVISALDPIIGLPIVIGAVLVTLYKAFETNFGGIRDITVQVWDKISSVTQSALGEVYSFTNDIVNKIIQWWQQNYPLIEQTVNSVNNGIKTAVGAVLAVIQALYERYGGTILTVVSKIWNAIKNTISFILAQILDVIKLMLELYNGQWEKAWNTVLSIVQRGARNVIAAFVWLENNGIKVIISIVTEIVKLWVGLNLKLGELTAKLAVALIKFFALLPGNLIKLVPTFLRAGLQIGQAVWQGIKEGLTGAFNVGTGEGDIGNDTDIMKLTGLQDFIDQMKGFQADPTKIGDPSVFLAKPIDTVTDSMKGLGDATDKTSGKIKKVKEDLKSLKDLDADQLLTLMRSGTSGQESGGNFSARNPRTGALGRFQVVPSNIPEWTRNTPGVGQMTVDQFRANPQAQIAVFNKYMGEYLKAALIMAKGNRDLAVRMAAAAWYGGADDMKNFDKNFGGKGSEPTFNEYTMSVLTRTKNAAAKYRRTGGIPGTGDERTLEQIADDNIFNKAKDRVQTLIELTRELNVVSSVPQEVTTTNQQLITLQELEIAKLEDLKKKRQDVREIVQKLGLDQSKYQIETNQQADESIKKLTALTDAQDFVQEQFDKSTEKISDLKNSFDGTLTPLEKFNADLDTFQRNSGLSTEELSKLIPKIEETKKNLEEIGNLEYSKKAAKELTDLANDVTDQVNKINRSITRLNKSPEGQRQLDVEDQVNAFIKEKGLKPEEAGKAQIQFQKLSDANRQLELAKMMADAVGDYNDEILDLNKSLSTTKDLTARQNLEWDLAYGKLKDLDEAQKDNLRTLADRVDILREMEKYHDTVKSIGDDFGSIFSDAFVAVFDKGVKGALDTLQTGLRKFFLGLVSRVGQYIQQKISDQIVNAITRRTSGAGSGTGPGGTPYYNPSGGGGFGGFINTIAGPAGGSGASSFSANSNVIQQILSGGGGAGGFGSGAGAASSGSNPFFAAAGGLGGAGNKRTNPFSTPLGQINDLSTIATAGRKPTNIFSSLFGKGGIFGSKGFGFNSGTIQGLGAIGGLAGGLIGGPVGAVLMGAASGIGLASSLASILSISSLGGPVGLAIGAAIGGVVALGSLIFGNQKQRRADERTRNQAMIDSLKSLDDLISAVNNDKIDGQSALQQADEIRKQYVDAMSQLKDSKTRNIALKDVSRLDEKISTLKAAVNNQVGRQANLLKLVPTFADGGTTSKWAAYHDLPTGYVKGPGDSKSDSILARLSNQEYVLDATTSRNIGIKNLDKIRKSKGRNLGSILRMMKHVDQPRMMADGGITGSNLGMVSDGYGSLSQQVSVSPQLYVQNIVHQTDEGIRIDTQAYLKTPEGKKQVVDAVEETIYRDKSQSRIVAALKRNT